MSKPSSLLSKLKDQAMVNRKKIHTRIRVGLATCGISAGADEVSQAFKEAVREAGIEGVSVIPTGCVGRCDLEPMAEVTKGDEPPVLYIKLNKEKAQRIVEEHLLNDRIVEEYVG